MSTLLTCRRAVLLLAVATLTACAPSDEERLRQWLDATQQASTHEPGPLAALPGPPTLPSPVATDADPFAAARIAAPVQTALANPEAGRRREPLEEFPLESMQMVGVLKRNGMRVAVLRIGEQLYHVGVGQYIGLRQGRVTRVTDQEIVLRELILDGETDWKEEMTSLKLEASS